MQLSGVNAALAEALELLQGSACPEVDNLADWLLVSAVQLEGPALEVVLAEEHGNAPNEDNPGSFSLRLARADGEKCERCWHYTSDVEEHTLVAGVNGRICGRCRQILAESAVAAKAE